MAKFQLTPVSLLAETRLAFAEARLISGVRLMPNEGPFADLIHGIQGPPGETLKFRGSHLVVVDVDEYFTALGERAAEALTAATPPPGMSSAPEPIVDGGVLRQALMTLVLGAGVGWDFGGTIHMHTDSAGKYVLDGLSPGPRGDVPWRTRRALFKAQQRSVTPLRLQLIARKLDVYYRPGRWLHDRLSTALGYLWSSLLAGQEELAFVGLMTALEGLLLTSKSAISSTLADRCAILVGHDIDTTLREVKHLYDVRSTIVHGGAAVKKGTMDRNSLLVSAKFTAIPERDFHMVVRLVVAVIGAALGNRRFLSIVQTAQTEKKVAKAIDGFFAT